MKRILLILTVLACASLTNALAVDDKTFFSGAYIGETIDQCLAYYYPHGIPAGLLAAMRTHGGIHGIGDRAAAASVGAISDAGSYWFSGAPDGEQRIDFRTYSNPQGDRHVEIYFRESDRKIVSVEYWKVSGDQTFDRDLIDYLVHLNRGRGLGTIVSKLYGGDVGQFIVKTEEQEKVEQGEGPVEPEKLHTESLRFDAQAVDDKAFFSGAYLGLSVGQFYAYYTSGPHPLATTAFQYSGAPEGQKNVDFRSYGTEDARHDWRVEVFFRESDRQIVSVDYLRAGQPFSKDEIRYLTDLNRGYGPLITSLSDDRQEFAITTPEQDKLLRAPVVPKEP